MLSWFCSPSPACCAVRPASPALPARPSLPGCGRSAAPLLSGSGGSEGAGSVRTGRRGGFAGRGFGLSLAESMASVAQQRQQAQEAARPSGLLRSLSWGPSYRACQARRGRRCGDRPRRQPAPGSSPRSPWCGGRALGRQAVGSQAAGRPSGAVTGQWCEAAGGALPVTEGCS